MVKRTRSSKDTTQSRKRRRTSQTKYRARARTNEVVRYSKGGGGRPTFTNFSPLIASDICRTKLKYIQRLAPTTAAGANYHQVFAANGCYDCDITGAGHQPMGFDQLTALYKQFRVFGSRIEMKITDTSATAGASAIELATVPSFTSSDFAATDPQTVAEEAYAKFTIVPTHTAGMTYHSNYIDIAKFYGRRRTDFSATDFYGSDSVNPANIVYWHVCAQAIDEATTLANLYIYLTITYYVEFSLRQPQNAS